MWRIKMNQDGRVLRGETVGSAGRSDMGLVARKVDLRIAALKHTNCLEEGDFHDRDYGEEKIVRQNELSLGHGES